MNKISNKNDLKQKNSADEKQRFPSALPSSKLDIGESLSVYLQTDINI